MCYSNPIEEGGVSDLIVKTSLTMEEVEKRFAEIDTRETEEPTAEDLLAFAMADAEDPADTIILEAYKAQRICKARGMRTSIEMSFPATVQPYHEFDIISTEQMARGDVSYDTIGC